MKYFSHSWEILLAIDPDDMVDVDLKLTFTLLDYNRFVRSFGSNIKLIKKFFVDLRKSTP